MASGSPSRLDIATKLGRQIPDGWWVVYYPDAAEASASFKRGVQGDRPVGRSGDGSGELDRSAAEAARRARGQVRRYAVANRLDRLGSLTFGGDGCHDPIELRTALSGFFKRLRVLLGVGRMPYLWVPELHPGGHGLHAHFAVARFVEKPLIERAWGHGFVDIRRLEARAVGSSPLARARIAAAYLGKYVAKAFAGGVGLHRYEVAQGFMPARLTLWAETEQEAVELCVSLRGGELPSRSSSSIEWAGWQGPPTVWMQWAV